MTRSYVILPYRGWKFYRLLNTLIILSFMILWYTIITNQETLNWYFIDKTSLDDKAEVSRPVQGQIPQPSNDNIQGIVEKAESEESQVAVSPKENAVETAENNFEQAPSIEDVVQVFPNEPFEILQRFEERNELITDLCELEKNPNYKQSNMYYFPQLEATWMPLYGASSSLWKKFFIDQYGRRRTSGDVYDILNLRRFALPIKKATKGNGLKTRRILKEPDDSLRFTIIRHPLSRLIAHFKKPQLDRRELVALKDQWVRPSIILGRNDPSWTDEQRAKFELELDQWIDGKLTPEQSPNNAFLSPPTFSEFVRFIINAYEKGDGRAQNAHWRPILEWLDICQNNIDIIVKQENYKAEIPVLLEEIDLVEHEEYFLENTEKANDLIFIPEYVP
eukprot:sb/3465498/